MTTEQQTSLNELEKSLWETADSLRNESSLTMLMKSIDGNLKELGL